MSTTGARGPVGVRCPGCGGADVAPVREAVGGGGAARKELAARLAKGPGKSGDALRHFVEGMVLVALSLAWAWMGTDPEKPLYVWGGIVLAVLLFIATIVVVRGDGREKAAERAGAERAAAFWDPAHYCRGCECVFCPRGEPWQGLLTPEQFKRLVWDEAGYADQLPPGERGNGAS
ncbi:hypothetical protein [Streptomyces flavofungini]|uniref:hypothetical protein n=1 Tax=Streptomyces flavofungini TaxID=68200 RepID=UPI0025B1C9B2|nr:hypothetical protein [Streptomyces flavofungini]WJV45530.1 hypothetical protein QUY26_08275 [Streptomyces flavofungini]